MEPNFEGMPFALADTYCVLIDSVLETVPTGLLRVYHVTVWSRRTPFNNAVTFVVGNGMNFAEARTMQSKVQDLARIARRLTNGA